jgi:hypothetical protein
LQRLLRTGKSTVFRRFKQPRQPLQPLTIEIGPQAAQSRAAMQLKPARTLQRFWGCSGNRQGSTSEVMETTARRKEIVTDADAPALKARRRPAGHGAGHADPSRLSKAPIAHQQLHGAGQPTHSEIPRVQCAVTEAMLLGGSQHLDELP